MFIQEPSGIVVLTIQASMFRHTSAISEDLVPNLNLKVEYCRGVGRVVHGLSRKLQAFESLEV